MHNGGKFDFMLMLRHMQIGQVIDLINGRIVRALFRGIEFRDSWALFPQALGSYQKTAIDYSKFEPGVFEQHEAEIRAYGMDDCVYLHDIIAPFVTMYGDALTVGNVALRQCNALHGFEALGERDDEALRPFYFGGRVQCFEEGDFHGDFKLYDVNSMYPAAMKNSRHPVSNYSNGRRIGKRTGYALIEATSDGCLPRRMDDGSLGFPHMCGEFFASVHEIEAGEDLGLLRVHSVTRTYEFEHWTTFGDFVDLFFELRAGAKAVGDKARDLIYKRVLNSAYGKFALDPRRFSLFQVTDQFEAMTPLRSEASPNGWLPNSEGEGWRVWDRPAEGRLGRFLNVATAASITGAARANLMRGLASSVRPLYCDTDSIICEAFGGDIDSKRLGAWDCEIAECDRATIAAKKIYALSYGGRVLKTAAKGARLGFDDIVRVANGELVEWKSEAPTFSLARGSQWIKRKIKRGSTIETDLGDDIQAIEEGTL
jgi:hypothetical protein